MLKEATARYELDSSKLLHFRAWVDEENGTVFFLGYSISGDGLNMAEYQYDAANDVYDVTEYASINLIALDKDYDFTTEDMEEFYKRMKSVNLYDYLRKYWDRSIEYDHGLERL
jgi:hypothetical protein